MKNLNPTYKGLLTGILMILVSVAIYFIKGNLDNGLRYITHLIYIGGIIWTLISFKQSTEEHKSFKNYFTQGFRCFVVIAFLMVVFTWVFVKANPAMKDEMARLYRADLVSSGNKTPNEIDTLVAAARENFVTMLTSIAIFGYLLIGALVTLVASAFLSQQKN